MHFTPLDQESWDRREIYDCFRDTVLYVTMEIDVTAFLADVRSRGLRFYPSLIHCIAKVVNRRVDYRYGYDEAGNIGTWDVIHPLYTVPRKSSPHLFSMVSTDYGDDFAGFYDRFLIDYERAETCGRLHCDASPRPCYLGITAVPALHFTGFAFGDPGKKPDLTPFVAVGRYENVRGKVTLPVCGEFSHAVNDGFHIGLFFKDLEAAMRAFVADRGTEVTS